MTDTTGPASAPATTDTTGLTAPPAPHAPHAGSAEPAAPPTTPAEPAFLRSTRAGYDAVAEEYAEFVRDELERNVLGRAMLDAFAGYVHAAGGGPVVEAGSGEGRVTAYLHSLGLDVRGVDLAPRMVALARRTYPELEFAVGSMTEPGLAEDGSLAGIVAWYSAVHVAPEWLPTVFAHFHRALAPGGRLLLAFQERDHELLVEWPFGAEAVLPYQPMTMAGTSRLLEEAGFEVTARLLREPEMTEKVPQAHLLARRPRPSGS